MGILPIIGLVLGGIWVFTSVGAIILASQPGGGSGNIGVLLLGIGWPLLIPYLVFQRIVEGFRGRR